MICLNSLEKKKYLIWIYQLFVDKKYAPWNWSTKIELYSLYLESKYSHNSGLALSHNSKQSKYIKKNTKQIYDFISFWSICLLGYIVKNFILYVKVVPMSIFVHLSFFRRYISNSEVLQQFSLNIQRLRCYCDWTLMWIIWKIVFLLRLKVLT